MQVAAIIPMDRISVDIDQPPVCLVLLLPQQVQRPFWIFLFLIIIIRIEVLIRFRIGGLVAMLVFARRWWCTLSLLIPPVTLWL